MTRNSPWQWRHTKSRSISVMLPMHAKPSGEKRTRRWGCVLNSSTAVTRFWERLSPGSRAAAGAVSPGQAGRTVSTALLGTDRHCLACKRLLGATVPCHSWLPPGLCCEVLLAVLKHLQPRRLDNKVAFKAFASSPARLLFKAPCYL